MSDIPPLPNVPKLLDGELGPWATPSKAQHEAARFAEHIRHLHTVSPGRPMRPPLVICPQDDIEDIFEAEDIRYTDGSTLAERIESD